MLDQKDRISALLKLPYDFHQFHRLLLIHAGCRLVQQDDLRRRRKASGNFQPALRTIGQTVRQMITQLLQMQKIQTFQCFLHSRFFLSSSPRCLKNRVQKVALCSAVHPYNHIVHHRKLFKQTNVLKGAGNSHFSDPIWLLSRDILSLQTDPALCRRVDSGNQIKQRRFPGSVRSDHTYNLTAVDADIDFTKRCETTELLRHMLYFQHFIFRHLPPLLYWLPYAFSSLLPPA